MEGMAAIHTSYRGSLTLAKGEPCISVGSGTSQLEVPYSLATYNDVWRIGEVADNGVQLLFSCC